MQETTLKSLHILQDHPDVSQCILNRILVRLYYKYTYIKVFLRPLNYS